MNQGQPERSKGSRHSTQWPRPVAVLGLVALLPLIALTPRTAKYDAELFAPGVVSTRDYERDGTFTPDGKTFYFTKRTIWPAFSAICVTHLRNGRWTEPEVAPFSGQYPDATPFISIDGNRLYFASRRPPSNAYNIWVARREGDRWSAPTRLPDSINGHGNVLSPVETRNGSLYFMRLDTAHTFVARKDGDGWASAVQAGSDNTEGTIERSAYIDPDERYMIVSVVGRPDALKTAEGIYDRGDLYVRERAGGDWSELRHLPAPINSGAEENSPFVSPDGRYLYFMSERGVFTEHGPAFDTEHLERALHAERNGLGDIYRIDFRATGIQR